MGKLGLFETIQSVINSKQTSGGYIKLYREKEAAHFMITKCGSRASLFFDLQI